VAQAEGLVKGPTLQAVFHYACFNLALRPFLNRPGDGRMQPEIPAANLAWALVLGALLRLNSANRLEWLARSADPAALGLERAFGDDALAYFTERLDPQAIRHCLVATLKLAKRNKVFDETTWLGLAIDGTGAGRTTQAACPLCHPVKDAQGRVTRQIHQLVMITVVGAGITLPFDVEPYQPGDSEYSAGKRLLKRAVNQLGPRFANYAVADGKFATAPFLHTADEAGIPILARLKDNLPELSAAVEARFGPRPPMARFLFGKDWIEVWDADDFDPWESLDWPTVRVLRYRQHKQDGSVIQADWLTNLPVARLGTRTFYRLAKSRWEIENQGFNEGKNLYGMEHIQHHHPNSLLVNWLFLLLALLIERLYRNRYLHRGTHPVLTAMQLKDTLWLNLCAAGTDTS
jgi:Transposase DDE domain